MKELFTSRRFWATLFALVVLVAGNFIPNFNMDGEAVAGFMVIIVSYVVGVSVDPGENAGNWRGVLKSRKFWAALIGVVFTMLDAFGVKMTGIITPDLALEIAVLLGGYIASIALH